MKPRTVCFCQPICSMISGSVAPSFRWSIATTFAVLLPSRGPALFSGFAAFLALGAFLAAVVFLVALAFAGAPLAGCAPPLAFLSDFGFGVSPRLRICSQIRPAAALAVLKLFTGFTPGRLFQIATRRSAGHCVASAASSCWLAKGSKGVAVVAAASSWVPNAVMLFCSSIVNVFIIVLLGATLCAVTTWITPVPHTSKRIMQGIDQGDGTAMTAVPDRRWQHLASDGSPQFNSRPQTGRRHRRVAHPTQCGGGGPRNRDRNKDAAPLDETAGVSGRLPPDRKST